MSDEASPRPWRAEPMGRVGMSTIVDSEGKYVAAVATINAEAIVNAVNYFDWLNKNNPTFCSGVRLIDENKRMRETFQLVLPALERAEGALRSATIVVRGWAQKGDTK